MIIEKLIIPDSLDVFPTHYSAQVMNAVVALRRLEAIGPYGDVEEMMAVYADMKVKNHIEDL